MYKKLCWTMTICCAVLAFSTHFTDSPTVFHRTWVGGTVAFMMLLNGWLWSRAGTVEVEAIFPTKTSL